MVVGFAQLAGGSMTNAIEIRAEARSYSEWLKVMEHFRLGLGRGWVSSWGLGPDPDLSNMPEMSSPGEFFAQRKGPYKHFKLSVDGPLPIDLKAYIVAKTFDPTKKHYTYGKIIPELVKHQEQLHPFARRYLLERLRDNEAKFKKLAQAYGDVANQFEVGSPPCKTADEPEAA